MSSKVWACILVSVCMGGAAYAGGSEASENSSYVCERNLLPTSEVISYLEALQDNGLLTPDRLQLLQHQLRTGEPLNPWASDVPTSTLQIHSRNLAQIQKHHPLDRTGLREWTDEALRRSGAQTTQRNGTREATEQRLGAFVRIRGGRVGVYIDRYAEIPDFEMMKSPVTQRMWEWRMKTNPSRFPGRPENPIENITWWAAAVYANRVSQEMGHAPYYNFDGIEWLPGTSAEEGTLLPQDLVAADPSRIPTGGYGYRFITVTEWMYVRERSVILQQIWNNTPDQPLGDYSWWYKNSGGTTQPVGTTPEFITIDGHEIYDLIGNVPVWGNTQNPFTDGVSTPSKGLLLLGGGFNDGADRLVHHHWNIDPSTHRGGIRLMRTVPPPGEE